MSQTRKAHIRTRFKNVERTLQILNNLNCSLKALDRANEVPIFSRLPKNEKYSYFSKRFVARRPIHLFRHYTKVEIPRLSNFMRAISTEKAGRDPPSCEKHDALETNLVTLSRHVLHSEKHHAASGDLTLLLTSIQVACKFIASKVRQAGLANLTGLAGQKNVQGEQVQKLDVVANEIFINSLKSSGKVAMMVSEENEEIIVVDDPMLRGKYVVVFDPLDGSSNIDSGVSIGTIFGIFEAKDMPDEKSNFLRSGRELVAAGYALYGSFTIMVLSTGNEVNGYTLDPNLGEFILTNPKIQIPYGKTYSINEGNTKYWSPECLKYFNSFKNMETTEAPYSLRYVGSMVADVHRTLLHGGIFAYPADKKSKNGKLRLLYECFPMAFITEKAGGLASNGMMPILDLIPSSIHERSPIILGNPSDVTKFESICKGSN